MANSYLTRTPSSNGNKQIFTFSTWLKRSKLGVEMGFFTGGSDANVDGFFTIQFKADDALNVQYYDGSFKNITPNRLFRDTSGWYHIVVAMDSTQGTASNRTKVYINGVQETSFADAEYPSQNQNFDINETANPMQIGVRRNGSAALESYFDGYLSHISWVDGQQLAPTVFGETDSTSGIWKFKQPSGVTWGTNGFHLKFENSGNLGLDSSGNSNTFTVNGNGRQALDTPSNVHATANPLQQNSTMLTFTNGNNTVAEPSGNSTSWTTRWGMSTLAFSSGKFYAEAKISDIGSQQLYPIGIVRDEDIPNINSSVGTNGYGLYISDGRIIGFGNDIQTGLGSFSTNDIIGLAVDADNRTFQYYKNGSTLGSQVTNITAGTYFFTSSAYANHGIQFNFGNGYFGTTAITSAGSNGNGSLFEYDVPSGYYALNTKNINTYG